MEKRIYVGNLPFSITQDGLRDLFSQYGEIEEATLVINKFSGRSKGFGFIEFKEESSAEKAVSEMNKKEVKGREIIVKEAVPFDPNKPRREFKRRGGFQRRSNLRESEEVDQESEEAPSKEEPKEEIDNQE